MPAIDCAFCGEINHLKYILDVKTQELDIIVL